MFGKSRTKSKTNLALSKESIGVSHDSGSDGLSGSRELLSFTDSSFQSRSVARFNCYRLLTAFVNIFLLSNMIGVN